MGSPWCGKVSTNLAAFKSTILNLWNIEQFLLNTKTSGSESQRSRKESKEKMQEVPEQNETSTDIQQAVHRLYESLENKESFTVEEAASLVLRRPLAVRQAVRRGELKGLIVDHHLICIPRQSLLDRLQTRPRILACHKWSQSLKTTRSTK